MKKNTFIFIIISIFVIILFSCDLLPVSIEERISLFVDALNSSAPDRQLYEHFHPDLGYYDQLDEDYFDSTPLSSANQPFSITPTGSPYDVGGGLQRVDANFDSDVLSSSNCYFRMKMDGQDWYIIYFYLDAWYIQKK